MEDFRRMVHVITYWIRNWLGLKKNTEIGHSRPQISEKRIIKEKVAEIWEISSLLLVQNWTHFSQFFYHVTHTTYSISLGQSDRFSMFGKNVK